MTEFRTFMSVYTANAADLSAKRDKKVRTHLEQYAPVWIIDETIVPEDEIVTFNVLFQHPRAGLNEQEAWVSRRYRYDGFNDVLHHRGQNVVDEDDALEIAEKEPYIRTRAADIPNSYGG